MAVTQRTRQKASSALEKLDHSAAADRLQHAGEMARKKIIERLDAERTVWVDVMEGVADELGSAAGRDEALYSRRVLERGDHYLRKAARRVRRESTAELVDNAAEALRRRPVLLIAGLVGAGALAARMLRAQTER